MKYVLHYFKTCCSKASLLFFYLFLVCQGPTRSNLAKMPARSLAIETFCTYLLFACWKIISVHDFIVNRWPFFKINFNKIAKKHYQIIKQFGSRSEPTSGFKLFAKVMYRRQTSLLACKSYTIYMYIAGITCIIWLLGTVKKVSLMFISGCGSAIPSA